MKSNIGSVKRLMVKLIKYDKTMINKTEITVVRNEREVITVDSKGIKKIVREYYE